MGGFPFHRKTTGLIVTALAIAVMAGGMIYMRQQAGTPFAYQTSDEPPELLSTPIAQHSLFNITGLPDTMDLSGEVRVGGTLHPLSLFEQIPGERAYAANGIEASKLHTTPHQFILRFNDRQTSRTIDADIQIDPARGVSVTLSGLPAQGMATLALNGREVYGRTLVDWNGRLNFQHPQEGITLVQISILPSEYESYSFFSGSLLPYYLQDYLATDDTLDGLPAFPLDSATTKANANELAQKLVGYDGRAFGWWLNKAETAIIARRVDSECLNSCHTRIFVKEGDEWREVFVGALDRVWVDGETIGQPDSGFYVGTANYNQYWSWQNGRYAPQTDGEDTP